MSARTLSRAYSASLYRATRGDQPRYSNVTSAGDCAECWARQHETGGATGEGNGRRAPARVRRDFPAHQDGAERALLLCAEHGHLWRERDAEDVARPVRAVPT